MVTRQPGDRVPAPDPAWFVQDFVNSVNIEFGPDRFADLAGFTAWVRERCPEAAPDTLSEADRELAVSAREHLRTLLRANAGHGTADWAGMAAYAAVARVTLAPRDGSLSLLPSGAGIEVLLGRLLESVHRSQVLGLWPRLKACEEDRCRWAFYDRSRNGAGRWCSMSVCGSRAKMAAYRGRRRSTASGARR
ncbi:CGNR zinc finger domain-containing protein [Myceligenerans cantabricum]